MAEKEVVENLEDDKPEKNDIRLVPKNILKNFIETYRSHPALWQIRNKEVYNNRNLKNQGYSALINVWKHYDHDADQKAVRLKIQSLRGSFRKEMKKVEKTSRSGSGAENVYVSNLWYFNLMSFLKDHEMPTKSIDNIEMSSITPDMDADKEWNLSEDEVDNVVEINHSNSNKTSTPNTMPKKRKVNEEWERRQFMSKCTAALDAKADENEALGQYISGKLSKVTNPEQRMYAESLLTKVLNKAIMNKLHEFSDISDYHSSTFYSSPSHADFSSELSNTDNSAFENIKQ